MKINIQKCQELVNTTNILIACRKMLQYAKKIESFLSRNVGALTYLKNFTGQRDGTGFPGKRQKLVPGQTFGKEWEIAVTSVYYHSKPSKSRF